MGASDFDDSFSDFSDGELDELAARPAVNRDVQETFISRPLQVQRTLTGEALAGEQTRYEEVQRTVTFRPTHHRLNRPALRSYIYPKNFEVRDYQFDIIAKALYQNVLCAIPTGMGKTFIASTVMLNYYNWFTHGKIIFMAPTRPLVAQQIQACLGVTDIPASDTAVLLDKTRKNRPEIWNSKRVFFTTPQVVENDLKAGTLDPKEIVCLVIDEAHRARKNYAYTNVVKFIERFNTSIRILALTATPASDIEGVQEVVNNLNLSLIEIRTEESDDIIKYMKRKETTRVNLGANEEMEEVAELICRAIEPTLRLANEAQIYDVTDPSRINAFQILQKSQAVVLNQSIPESVKWRNYFILQLLGAAGNMLKRLKIYGVRSFYSFFLNKRKEFQTKYELGKSSNKWAKSFYYHQALKQIDKICQPLIADKKYVSHPKLEYLLTELEFFVDQHKNSRVIVFTELRESALEIVQTIDNNMGDTCKAHIFIGQAKGKEGFDEVEYKMKNGKKGRGKAAREERLEKEAAILEEKENKKKEDAAKRATSRTFTSEEAQLQGMNQKQQKELIKKFKKGEFQVLVATSIGEEGLDIGEVDMIICYDTTSSPIKNIQRMGRTGRKNDGKVVLLLAGNEESKFNQAMEDYANVQKQIENGDLDMHESDRIIPKDVHPVCEKRFIEVPEDNLIISRGEDSDEVIKHATQAMLGKVKKGKKTSLDNLGTRKGKGKALDVSTPAPKKRFFMPDDVETGFVNSSRLVRKVVPGKTSENSICLDSDGDDEDDNTASTVANKKTTTSSSSNNSAILKGLFSSASKSNTPRKTGMPQVDDTPVRKRPTPSKESSSRNASFTKPVTPSKTTSSRHTSFTKPTSPIKSTEIVAIDDDDDDDFMDDENDDILHILSHVPKTMVGGGSPHLPDPVNKAKFPSPISPLDPKTTETRNESVEKRDNSILGDLSFSKAFEDDDDEEIPGSDFDVPNSDDQDSRIFQDTLENIRLAKKKQRLVLGDDSPQDPISLTAQLLNFEAYEDNGQDLGSLQPLRDAAVVMEKQYQEDPSFQETSFEASGPVSKKNEKNTKRLSEEGLASAKKKRPKVLAEKTTVNNRFDISKMLKDRPKKSLELAKVKRVDLTDVKASQIIDLDSMSQGGTQPGYMKKPPTPLGKVYMSQKDCVASVEFDPLEGFLTEEESTQFISEYFVANAPAVMTDPRTSARLNVYGKIPHVAKTKRLVNLFNLCGARKRLNKMVSEMDERSEKPYDENVKPSDIIVGEDGVVFVKMEMPLMDHDTDLEVNTDGILAPDPLDGFPSTVSLLDDDDDEFNEL